MEKHVNKMDQSQSYSMKIKGLVFHLDLIFYLMRITDLVPLILATIIVEICTRRQITSSLKLRCMIYTY